MKTKISHRILALVLSLVMLFSVLAASTATVSAAKVDLAPTAIGAEEIMETTSGLMDIAAGFSWMGGDTIAGAVNGSVAAIGFAFSLINTFVGSSGPTFEEVLFNYLQEMRTEIIGKIDDVQLQVSEMQRELQDFIMLAFEIDDFDDVYVNVAQRFDGNSSTDFTSLVTNYVSDPNLSDNAKATLLGNLVGDHEQWNQEGTTIYALDTYKNYLLGKTAVFNNKTIYQAAIEYYQSDALLGQEVLDRYDNEFAGRVYATYAAAVPKVIVCLQAKELLLKKQAEELREDAAETDNPRESQSMIDDAQIKEKEAELCRLKELEYVGSFTQIYETFSLARATIHPYDYYDRSDTGSPMVTRYLSTELGKRDFYNEALAIYKNKAGRDLNIGDQDQIHFANCWYNSAMLGEKQYPEQTSLLPTLKKTLEATGLSDASRKYFADYILREHPSKTIREFLTDYGFDADSQENSSAGVFAVKSRTADTESVDWQYKAFNIFGDKAFGYVFGKLTYDYYALDTVAPEYFVDKIYSAGGKYDAASYAPTAKNVPGGYTVPTLYLQTAPFDTSNLELWITRADDVIATQARIGKYTADSYAAITQKYAAATTVLTNAEQSPDTVTQSAIDTATSELIHALLSRKIDQSYYTTWEYLQQQIDSAAGSVTITLSGDVVATENDTVLMIPEGKSITLDLNGYTLDRGLADKDAVENGHLISNEGELTIIDSSAEQTGTITGGKSLNSVGGIYNKGTMTFSGGTITGNSVPATGKNGAGIYTTSTLNITGGVITGNSSGSGNGGGIYFTGGDAVLNLSGSPVITGNTAGGQANDVFINNNTSGVVNIVGKLDASAKIGIREHTRATGNAFTQNLPGNGTTDNFVTNYSDTTIVLNDNGEAYTANNESIYYVTFDANGGTGAVPEPMHGLTGQECTLPDTDLTGPDGKLFIGWKIGEALYSAGEKVVLSSFVTAVAQWGNKDWKSLQNMIDLKADGTVLKLDSDYTAEADDTALVIPQGKALTIDLNGHTLDRGLADSDAVANGNVISNYGHLTITDTAEDGGGVITGGNTNDAGGGIYCNYFNNANASLTIEGGSIIGNRAKYGGGIWTSRHLIMTGGSVSGNTATKYGGGIAFNGGSSYGIELYGVEIKNNTAGTQGGGVFNGDWAQVRNCTISGNTAEQGGGIYNGGTLDFYSGVISGNTATTQGGGIYNNDSNLRLQLSDTATITGNKAVLGGGVYTKGSNVFLSGAPQITDNTKTTGGADNLYITDNTQMKVQNGFTSDAKIGVSVNQSSTSSQALTNGLAQSGATYEVFTSDDAGYKVIANSDDEAVLAKYYKVRISSSYITADKKTACAGETVTLTVTPREGFTLEYLRCNGKDIVDNTFTMPDYDAVIQASFVRKKYTVIWQDEDGAVLETDENVTHGSAPSFDGTIPEKEGKTFVGWNNGETVYAAGDLPKVTEDVTYTAVFTAIEDDTDKYIRGDADGSGEISILDATAIQRKLVGYSIESFNEEAACITGDVLGILDATAIQRYLAGYDDSYDIGVPVS